jgi:hypothetical protein
MISVSVLIKMPADMSAKIILSQRTGTFAADFTPREAKIATPKEMGMAKGQTM